MKRKDIFDCTRKRIYNHPIYGISVCANTPFRATYLIGHSLFNISKSIQHNIKDITDYPSLFIWLINTSAKNKYKIKIDRVFQK